ncbi:MAG: hypothetical protein JWO15_3520 [Sphingomonadales bacterium]|nr:hypothetical protein [Sphingomonadales bacterium]
MTDFPSNSRRPERPREPDEPKRVEQVVQGKVTQRKTPLGRRMSRNLFGGDVHSVWGYVFGDVLIPAARDAIADAVNGGIERVIFGDGGGSRSRHRSSSRGHTPYNRYSSPQSRPRDEPRRELSHRARANHSFDEIILDSRVEAEDVIRRLDDLAERYDAVSVRDLYSMVGITSSYTDEKWGWTDLRDAYVSRVRNGYLLNIPKPEPID